MTLCSSALFTRHSILPLLALSTLTAEGLRAKLPTWIAPGVNETGVRIPSVLLPLALTAAPEDAGIMLANLTPTRITYVV